MPASSAALLAQLQATGNLEVIAATILDMEETEEGARVLIKRRKHTSTEEIEVDRVINCTGPQSDFATLSIPLVQQLLTQGLIKPDALRLGLETDPDGTVLNAGGAAVKGLFTIGPAQKSMLYESTALKEIRQQAKDLAHKILQENNAYTKECLVN